MEGVSTSQVEIFRLTLLKSSFLRRCLRLIAFVDLNLSVDLFNSLVNLVEVHYVVSHRLVGYSYCWFHL